MSHPIEQEAADAAYTQIAVAVLNAMVAAGEDVNNDDLYLARYRGAREALKRKLERS